MLPHLIASNYPLLQHLTGSVHDFQVSNPDGCSHFSCLVFQQRIINSFQFSSKNYTHTVPLFAVYLIQLD